MDEQTVARIVTAVAVALRPEQDGTPPPPHAAPVRIEVAIAKADVDVTRGIIFGTASTSRPDRQADEIDPEDLETAAYEFMASVQKAAKDTHGPDIPGAFVASWVEDGVWRIGFRPDDIEVARAAAKGEYVGFSIGGEAERVS